MLDQTISNRSTQFNSILKSLLDFYREPTNKLIKHLYSKGYSQKKVAQILGISPQAVGQLYPKGGKK